MATGSDKRQRKRLITFRVTDEEHARYQERASRAGLAVGAFARAAGLNEAGPRARRRRPIEHAALAQLMAAMNRVGNNLNQIARKINTGGKPTGELAATLAAVRRSAERIDAAVDELSLS